MMAWRKKVYQEKNELFEKTVAAKRKHSEDLEIVPLAFLHSRRFLCSVEGSIRLSSWALNLRQA